MRATAKQDIKKYLFGIVTFISILVIAILLK